MYTSMFVSETKSSSPLFDGIVTGKCGYNFNRLNEKKSTIVRDYTRVWTGKISPVTQEKLQVISFELVLR